MKYNYSHSAFFDYLLLYLPSLFILPGFEPFSSVAKIKKYKNTLLATNNSEIIVHLYFKTLDKKI